MPTTIKNHVPFLTILYKDIELFILLQDDADYPFKGFYQTHNDSSTVEGATFEATLAQLCDNIDEFQEYLENI